MPRKFRGGTKGGLAAEQRVTGTCVIAAFRDQVSRMSWVFRVISSKTLYYIFLFLITQTGF